MPLYILGQGKQINYPRVTKCHDCHTWRDMICDNSDDRDRVNDANLWRFLPRVLIRWSALSSALINSILAPTLTPHSLPDSEQCLITTRPDRPGPGELEGGKGLLAQQGYGTFLPIAQKRQAKTAVEFIHQFHCVLLTYCMLSILLWST